MKSIKDEASRGLAKITNMVAVANKEIVSMVLIGETGSGKSSLINLFSFWARESLGGQPQFGDAKRLSILRHDNEAGSSQSGSQTLKPHVYQFDVQMNGRDYHCSILDSPGMGDVAGLENDDEHIGAILKFVEETSSINGIILMLNGSNCRMSPRTHYILQRLYSMCAKTFEEHIYLIFSNTQLRPNFDWKNEIKVPVDPNRVVPFDNLLYSPAGLEYEHLSAFEKMKIESNYVENKKTLSVLFETLRKGTETVVTRDS